MEWQYTKNGLPKTAGTYYVAMHYLGGLQPSERIWERYFDPNNPNANNFCDMAPVKQGIAEIYAWLPIECGKLTPPPYEQEKHGYGLTDSQLVRLLVCQSQGLDGYYKVCDRVGDAIGNDCSTFCPFGAPDTGFLNENCCAEETQLKLMLLAAKRLADLTGSPLASEIPLPYGEKEYLYVREEETK